ncbi:hypothetical protein CDAR_617821 [Caerostris darwini]|uniref:Uncharacterized protein n=1 Tax=Caerostris darwini TaxID=1538125 RepID=A0AAV4WGN9_9ARAC|nr:hypothetical protein CDAR_617821 [Caerostris darwini]
MSEGSFFLSSDFLRHSSLLMYATDLASGPRQKCFLIFLRIFLPEIITPLNSHDDDSNLNSQSQPVAFDVSQTFNFDKDIATIKEFTPEEKIKYLIDFYNETSNNIRSRTTSQSSMQVAFQMKNVALIAEKWKSQIIQKHSTASEKDFKNCCG